MKLKKKSPQPVKPWTETFKPWMAAVLVIAGAIVAGLLARLFN